ncbi:MAG: hypothetical protein U0990_09885 [Candidatus Nanopelagicales bacterium]|nr:hypothetical protein [Candidatus Nanopelagicales bacterium]MDZ4250386.1 hypothetical protein [Candidatus Nanopelagicales bacterium]MDZ7577977.1 hypothetical protein [Candidatus Nanopelagicales bacterium]
MSPLYTFVWAVEVVGAVLIAGLAVWLGWSIATEGRVRAAADSSADQSEG